MNVIRKHKRILALALCLCTVLSLVSCALFGSTTASAEGYGGKITLRAEKQEDGTFLLTVEKHSETPGFGDVALTRLLDILNGEQTLAVDALSGATVTTTAAMQAAEKALDRAGFDTDELKSRVPFTNIEVISLDYEVVIVGAGGAGLTAAISAAEAGAKVLVLEKLGVAGGSTARSYGYIMASGTPQQDFDLIEDSSASFAGHLAAFAPGADGSRLIDLADHSAVNLARLVALGVPVTERVSASWEGQAPERVHEIGTDEGLSGGYIIQPLLDRCEQLGVTVFYNTEAVSLRVTPTMEVAGVVAKDQFGNTYDIYADATVLATGGFDKNDTLLQDVIGCSAADIVSVSGLGSTGDGLQMAMDAGALVSGGAPLGELYDYYADTNGTFGLLVTPAGERFANEAGRSFDVSGSLYAEGYARAYYITDKRGYSAAFKQGVENGDILTADTIEGLASAMGAPDLAYTVENYNRMCERGVDTLFGKPAQYLDDITVGPFYAVPYLSKTYGTVGGLSTNIGCMVLGEYGPIPGLYAAGELANSDFFSCVYPGFGASLAQTLETGRAAGVNAARYSETVEARELSALTQIHRENLKEAQAASKRRYYYW